MSVTLEHFRRAAVDVGAHGDNDTLPFDVDSAFIKATSADIAFLAYEFFSRLDSLNQKNAKTAINSIPVFSERLLVPTGPAGFRITTKMDPFWNIYFNGLGVAIAEKNEPKRNERAHSYRFIREGEGLFNQDRSWRAYRVKTLSDDALKKDGAIVVQTDISSFYERIYHHRLENAVNDLFPDNSTIGVQVDRLLNQFAAGRSFGLPVGGQCARILAELLMTAIDQRLSDEGVTWHRYVDDFTLISESHEEAYKDLSVLSHALADYGLSLNRSKTTMLSSKHYIDYVNTQIGTTDQESQALRKIDLHFDPYSDSKMGDYSELKQTVQALDVQSLLTNELKKSQPESFIVAQISRTLKFHSPLIAMQLCSTLLNPKNLHAFRASWSTIMRGIAAVRNDEENGEIFDELDILLDEIITHSSHLLQAEASLLHYLRAIRFSKTEVRSRFVLDCYNRTASETVKRACIECWRTWGDRPAIIHLRNQWNNLGPNAQRMLWLAFYEFGDDGRAAQAQLRLSALHSWALAIENDDGKSFAKLYLEWSRNGV